MELIIKKHNFIDIGFINFLLDHLVLYALYIFEENKCRGIDKYLSDNIFTEKHKYNSKLIIIASLSNMKVDEYLDRYVLSVKESPLIYPYNVTWKLIMRLVTYGNIQVNGYNIFEKLKQYIINNFDRIYKVYSAGV